MAVPWVWYKQIGLPRKQGTDDLCQRVWDDSTIRPLQTLNVGTIIHCSSTFGLIVFGDIPFFCWGFHHTKLKEKYKRKACKTLMLCFITEFVVWVRYNKANGHT